MPSNPHESEATPPEAVLIRRARNARGLTPDQAAGKLKIKLSGRRWRHLEDAKETGKPGVQILIGHTQLAHMAWVVGVTPDQLEEVGRYEAAEILRLIERQESAPAPALAGPDEVALREAGLPPDIPRSDLPPWAQQMYERLTLITDDEVDLLVGFLSSTSRKKPSSAAAARRSDRRAL